MNGHADSRRRFLKAIGSLGVAGLVVSYPVCVERFWVEINRYRVPVPNLPAPFAGLRIIHLTDFHYGMLIPLSLVRWAVHRANELRGDLVVSTGDYVHQRNGIDDLNRFWPVHTHLTARHGVYSVLGNHDHWADEARAQYWLERSGQDLRHRVATIDRGGERLWFAGAGDFTEDPRPLDGVLGQIPEDECRIVLAHNPDTADTPHKGRVDLMISGHTHGGQIDIPGLGPPILPVRNRAYTRGLKTSSRGEKVFISKGLGSSILPVRLNCRPEIAVLELFPDPAGAPA